MSRFFSIKGCIDNYGNSQFNVSATGYSTVDFIDQDGRRVRVSGVLVTAIGQPCIYAGAEGEFFFVKMRERLSSFKHCYAAHLSDGNNFFDESLETKAIVRGCIYFGVGFMLASSLSFIVGVLPMIYGGLRVAYAMINQQKKRNLFFHIDRDRAQALREQAIVQI